MLKIVECPRDAMQGIVHPIPTELKIEYINELLKVGFDTLDFGSFVSPKAIPQMADTKQVLAGLDLSRTKSKLLAIVVNLRGAQEACEYDEIDYLGYPFSISETFQQRNSRKSMDESFELVQEMQALCEKNGKTLVIYISMAFGNPYGDPWSPELAETWVEKMVNMGIKIISVADTAGVATPDRISHLFEKLIPTFPNIEIGAHFHSHPETRKEKLQAAWKQGCQRFDTALNGYGGCPFAKDELVGNIATESLLSFCKENSISVDLDLDALGNAARIAQRVFT